MTTIGEGFAEALARKDAAGIRALLAPDVDFKALTPRRFWEGSTPEEVVEVLFGHWFEEHKVFEALTLVEEGDAVGDTRHVTYRLDLTTPDGPHVVEQQAYYRTDGDQVAYLRVLCSGIRPRT